MELRLEALVAAKEIQLTLAPPGGGQGALPNSFSFSRCALTVAFGEAPFPSIYIFTLHE